MGRHRKERPELDATDSRGFGARACGYLKKLEVKGYSAHTLIKRRNALCIFIRWCHECGVYRPEDVTRVLLERYQRWAFAHRTAEGKPWRVTYQSDLLGTVRLFFGWMAKNNWVLFNPGAELELPRIDKKLPQYVLTTKEVEQVMVQPDLASPAGLRDRAMLETLYSTGMRRAELVNLGVYDVQMEQGTVVVRQGKGKKDRVVPIGERALLWIRKYLCDGRPYLLDRRTECGALFLTSAGMRFQPNVVSANLHRHMVAAGVGKKGACHIFRHTAATLMLENGADVRFIQQMLGHEQVTTTEVYTAVSIKALRQVHAATHPGLKK